MALLRPVKKTRLQSADLAAITATEADVTVANFANSDHDKLAVAIPNLGQIAVVFHGLVKISSAFAASSESTVPNWLSQ